MKKRFLVVVVALLGFVVFTTMVWAQCDNLPGYPVGATYTHPGANSFFNIVLNGVGSGYDVTDSVPYTGWCIEDNGRSNTTPVMLYCSTDPGIPSGLQSVPWDKVNYLLNHKQGTWQEQQAALWVLAWGFSNIYPVTPTAQAMIDDANATGAGFVPAPGEVVAAILYTGDGGIGTDGFQDTIIEIVVTDGGAGCTPGYWKQEHHLDSWIATGYDPTDDFDTTFGVDFFDPEITLYDAAWARGGGVKRLARHGTAALLSAAHPDVYYPYTVAQVIALVQGGDADALEAANELGCPLN